MNTVKETTLHPEGNDGVDLYPKTNINQVQELPQKLTSVENQINQLNIDKLTKPSNPTAESAVTMLADGTVGTKLLSEIGGGGKLYLHRIDVSSVESGDTISITIINTSLKPITDIEYIKSDLVQGTLGYYNGIDGKGAVSFYIDANNNYRVEGVIVADNDIVYCLNFSTGFDKFEDISRTEL